MKKQNGEGEWSGRVTTHATEPNQPFHGASEKQPPVPRAALMEELVMVAKFDP
jgi:hypothetical protein